MRFLTVLTISLCPVFAQSIDRDWQFAQPGATLVGGVRVEALLQSPILNTVIEQATAKDPTMTAMVGMLRGVLDGVSEVRFSMLDAGTGNQPEVLTLVTGRMDDAAAKALSQGKATVHRVDANTLLLGDAGPVAAAVQRLTRPSAAVQNRAVQRGKSLSSYDLWIAGTLPAMPMTAALGDMLHGLALGFSLRDDFRAEVALETASADMAAELIRQARAAQREQPETAGAALEAEVDGTTARFRVSVEKKILDQAIQEAVASGKLGSNSLFGTSAATPPLPKFKEKEPERKTIMIYGLDDGPREIDPANAH
jgi:hypothetical protein